MYKCAKCGTMYLRLEDKLKCEATPIQEPIIEVGTILIDDSYNTQEPIRCSAIYKSGHDMAYKFEWQRDSLGVWEYLYTIGGNERLDEFREVFAT
ncbi:hypothetical protein D3C76_187400 [compost metagenome]